jgi:hypothetical protein
VEGGEITDITIHASLSFLFAAGAEKKKFSDHT